MTNEFSTLKSGVLSYLNSLRLDSYNYAFTRGGDANIYSTILALFTIDLFDSVDKEYSQKDRLSLIEFIQSHQNPQSGMFEPRITRSLNRPVRNYLQLTTFALSALEILKSEPLYGLPFEQELTDPDFIDEYFDLYGVLHGERGSGNMAMFIGIFLSLLNERKEGYRDSMKRWYLSLENSANENGFWGSGTEKLYFNGIQNGYHQYVIYNYTGRQVLKASNILKSLRFCYDGFGHFAPFPGGAACEDYDALFLYILVSRQLNITGDPKISLSKIRREILLSQNDDGGFCQSNLPLAQLAQRFVVGLFFWEPLGMKLLKMRKGIGFFQRYKQGIKVDWFASRRRVNESNLWDTWFKCLMLAELDRLDGNQRFKFQRLIGLGNAIR